jgi:hypothetical protein
VVVVVGLRIATISLLCREPDTPLLLTQAGVRGSILMPEQIPELQLLLAMVLKGALVVAPGLSSLALLDTTAALVAVNLLVPEATLMLGQVAAEVLVVIAIPAQTVGVQ